MSEFINTIDLLGEQVVFDKLVEDSSDLTEFNDNKINELRECAFVSSHLQYVRLPIVKKICQYAFQNQIDLKLLEIGSDCQLANLNVFPDKLSIFVVQVPDEDVDVYKSASTWQYLSSRICGRSDIENYIWHEEEIEDSFEEIAESINDRTAFTKYKCGQYKAVDLGVNGIIRMQIIDKNVRELADSTEKAQLEWAAMDLTAFSCSYSESGQGHYDDSTIKNVLDTTVWDALPTALKNIIKETKMTYLTYAPSENTQTVWTTAKLRIPSRREYFLHSGGYQTEGVGVQGQRLRNFNFQNAYWLRQGLGHASQACYVLSDGTTSSGQKTMKLPLRICFST